ncbi:MAG: hypothetical protein IT462_08495 [Planctomycetes bacterium]|nr:hypothetical protein [Planctomycetota bacterium]
MPDLNEPSLLVALVAIFVVASAVASGLALSLTWLWGRSAAITNALLGYVVGGIAGGATLWIAGSVTGHSERAGLVGETLIALPFAPILISPRISPDNATNWVIGAVGLVTWLLPLTFAAAAARVGIHLHETLNPWTGQQVIADVVAPPMVPQDPVAAMEYKAPIIAHLHDPEPASTKIPVVAAPPALPQQS